jgi:hypothetical protein
MDREVDSRLKIDSGSILRAGSYNNNLIIKNGLLGRRGGRGGGFIAEHYFNSQIIAGTKKWITAIIWL